MSEYDLRLLYFCGILKPCKTLFLGDYKIMDIIKIESRKIWDVLIEYAKEKQILTYGELDKITGIFYREQNVRLGYIQDFCIQNNYPPLTVLVRNKQTKKPGAGFFACTEDQIVQKTKEVYTFDWTSKTSEFDIFLQNQSR